MIDPDVLVDAIRSKLIEMPELVPALFAAGQVVAYHYEPPSAQDVSKAMYALNPPQMLVVHRGTRTGPFGRNETIQHDFSLVFQRDGKAGLVFVAVREGIPSSIGLKFKLAQVDQAVTPPQNMVFGYRTVQISEQSFQDYPEITFMLAERGVDN